MKQASLVSLSISQLIKGPSTCTYKRDFVIHSSQYLGWLTTVGSCYILLYRDYGKYF
mgnify:FL=1